MMLRVSSFKTTLCLCLGTYAMIARRVESLCCLIIRAKWPDDPWLSPSTGPFTMPEQQKEGYVHGHPADSHLLRDVYISMRRPGDRRGWEIDEGDRRPRAS